ncbi:hypothetical protein A9Q84_11090 [Halobacteriovorax marinus]|uniref:2-oxoadipate dioxygenase/decarboxylase n=1 Tax=Halobacteriovorax marinus TaxID=97084 RepID=A0A1Y5F7X0_9BACT|nr:hypothetical protein A9Q84_11090 [Halobacteriovorax marinus]
MNIEELLKTFWNDYLAITPVAKQVNDLLLKNGKTIVNDHIALRTFAHAKTSKEKIAKFFLDFGYEIRGDYDFEEKKLNAIHLENTRDANLPKIFISELRYLELNPENSEVIQRELDSLSELSVMELFTKSSVFNVSIKEYESLAGESEYAAWMCAIGFRPNHFTIDVNKLENFSSLLDLNNLLKQNGVALNTFGGEIKGAPSVYLEQTSTMADKIEVELLDGKKEVPSCYYEFAFRYKLPSGEFYQGFVTNSADKIFESTNVKN